MNSIIVPENLIYGKDNVASGFFDTEATDAAFRIQLKTLVMQQTGLYIGEILISADDSVFEIVLENPDAEAKNIIFELIHEIEPVIYWYE